jgi:hypothetical protein
MSTTFNFRLNIDESCTANNEPGRLPSPLPEKGGEYGAAG